MLSKQSVQSSRYTDCDGRGGLSDAAAAWEHDAILSVVGDVLSE